MSKAHEKALGKMKGDGEYSKVSFTPKNKREAKNFNKHFKSKTS